MRPVVGIDAHKDSCTYVVRHWNKTLAGPTRILSTRAATTNLAKQYPDHDFVLEVCPVHEWMVDLFRESGEKPIAVVPPKKGPVGKKSDDDDATRLAKKHQAGDLVEVYVGPPHLRRIRNTVRQHEFLKTRWVGLNNNLKAALLRWNFQPTKTRGNERKPDVYCDEGSLQVLEALPYLAGLYAVIDVVDEQMALLKKQIEGIGKTIPEVQLLQSIPGAGPIISPALYVEIGEIERFDKAESLVRYFGLDPVHGSSGDKHRDGHRISKTGVSYVRGAGVLVACDVLPRERHRAELRAPGPPWQDKAAGAHDGGAALGQVRLLDAQREARIHDQRACPLNEMQDHGFGSWCRVNMCGKGGPSRSAANPTTCRNP